MEKMKTFMESSRGLDAGTIIDAIFLSMATVGHVVNGQKVPITQEEHTGISVSDVDLKEWVNIVFCDTKIANI